MSDTYQKQSNGTYAQIVTPVGGSIGTVTTANTVPKTVFYADHSAVLAAAASTVMTARDVTTANSYNKYRVRVISPVAGTLNVYHGANATIASNKIVHTSPIVANTPYFIEIPLTARYIGCQFVNGAAASGTTVEVQSALTS